MLRSKKQWWIAFVALTGVLFASATPFVSSASPQKGKKPPTGSSKQTVNKANNTTQGVVYTPETLTGPEVVVLPPPHSVTAASVATYTVMFDPPAGDEEGIDDDDDSDNYPNDKPSASKRGILFKVRLYFYDNVKKVNTGDVKHIGYKITGKSGLERGHITANFGLKFTKDFKFPNPGQTSATILVEVQRLNPDATSPSDYAKYRGKVITVH